MAYESYSLEAKAWEIDLPKRFAHDSHFVFLDTQSNEDRVGEYDWIAAGGMMKEFNPSAEVIATLRNQRKQHPGWWFGRINYDFKNHIEKLHSSNDDAFGWSDIRFFLAGWVVTKKAGEVQLHVHSDFGGKADWEALLASKKVNTASSSPVRLQPQMSKDSYLMKAESLLSHIQRGDIYEVNFCQQFIAEGAEINPVQLYFELQKVASPPMSAFWHVENEWAISMSPERYLRKKGTRLISQPIKGTAKRGSDPAQDRALASQLRESKKEQAENVMIVDLVRNDLSRVAMRGTVEVTELFGIHSFQTVHQMISTVEAELAENADVWDVIEASFPMGSMTGAPKVSAMQLIEEHEEHKRGLYSGAIGYITPEDDLDFNVVIRTVLYDSIQKAVSVSVGSALTSEAIAESEWEECLIKLDAIAKVLGRENTLAKSE